MKKQKRSLPKPPPPAPVPAGDTRPFGRTFLLKDSVLLPEPGLSLEKETLLLSMMTQEECTKLVLANRAVLFGEKTIGLNANPKANVYPWDAFLFDFSDPQKPRCYLLSVTRGSTLAMLTMITTNANLLRKDKRDALIGELTEHIRKDKRVGKAIGALLAGNWTVDTMLEYAIRKTLRGLCIVNEDDPDGEKLINAYVEANSHALDVIYLHKYRAGKSLVLSMVPPFSDLKTEAKQPPKERVIHTEADHLEKASSLARTIYEKLRAEALKLDKSLVVNPRGKHYISLRREGGKNLAFFHFRRGGIYLVVMLGEQTVRKQVKKAEIKSLPKSVQSFWNGASTGLVISSTEHLKEITELFKKLIKQ
ncbi:MAG: hypothetical protein FD123_777 [Bacteroidetes bacterium]|nr:MAG: hypothetical protein FD123_777 [Bacteroidota bacterium]